MKCFKCEKGTMKAAVTDVTGEVRGEKYTVRTEAMVCPKCGFQVLTDEQSAAYTIAIADAYRNAHGLLTTREFKAARKRLGMSQRSFAAFLRVGEASVKRWESGLIQDEAYDQLIRLRTDLSAARANVAEIEHASGERTTVWQAEVTIRQPNQSTQWTDWGEVELAKLPRIPLDYCASA